MALGACFRRTVRAAQSIPRGMVYRVGDAQTDLHYRLGYAQAQKCPPYSAINWAIGQAAQQRPMSKWGSWINGPTSRPSAQS